MTSRKSQEPRRPCGPTTRLEPDDLWGALCEWRSRFDRSQSNWKLLYLIFGSIGPVAAAAATVLGAVDAPIGTKVGVGALATLSVSIATLYNFAGRWQQSRADRGKVEALLVDLEGGTKQPTEIWGRLSSIVGDHYSSLKADATVEMV